MMNVSTNVPTSVPMRRRERLLGALPMLVRRPPPVPASDGLMSLLCEILRAEPLLGRSFERLRIVARHDDDQDGRRRLLAFLFDGDAETPLAVAKVQSDLRNGSLQTEAAALTSVRALVGPELRKTIPDLLRTYSDARGEVLVVSALPGRSPWHELHASLLPSRRVHAHFEQAARWLAAFHQTTRHDDETTAVHGDFWAHNILHDSNDNLSVIDWENFAPAGSRYLDLFHYPLTYGQAYPGPFYRPLDAETAFARTFLQKNPLSRAVHQYLEIYRARTGIPHPKITAAFRELLASHATTQAAAHPGVRHLPWARFVTLLDAAGESVFD